MERDTITAVCEETGEIETLRPRADLLKFCRADIERIGGLGYDEHTFPNMVREFGEMPPPDEIGIAATAAAWLWVDEQNRDRGAR
jgi:hypothetical protein